MKVLTKTATARQVFCAFPRCEKPSETIDVPESLFDGDKIREEHRNTFHGNFYVTGWGEVCCCYDCYRELTLF
jgi:hypothetical protein